MYLVGPERDGRERRIYTFEVRSESRTEALKMRNRLWDMLKALYFLVFCFIIFILECPMSSHNPSS